MTFSSDASLVLILLGFADNLIISTMKSLFDTLKHCILVSCIMIKQQSELVSMKKVNKQCLLDPPPHV